MGRQLFSDRTAGKRDKSLLLHHQASSHLQYTKKKTKWVMHACSVAQLCLTLCDPMDCSPPGSMGFSKQEYWSGLPFATPGDLPNSGIEASSLESSALVFLESNRSSSHDIILTQTSNVFMSHINIGPIFITEEMTVSLF